jgi:hypothetical protein
VKTFTIKLYGIVDHKRNVKYILVQVTV